MLSDTIYFFHDIKNDESKTNLKIKSKFVHHTVKSSLFTMNEIAVSKKIRELNAKKGFKFYIFDKAERLKIAGLGPYSMDASIVKSDAQKILLTFAQTDLIYLDSSLSLSSSKKYIFQLIESYRFLLRSIDLLVCNRLIHNGINFDTILIKKEAPILTNFMFTVDLQGTTAFNWSQYFLERPLDKFCPVEFYLLQYQVTNNQVLSVYNIETIIRQFIKNNGLTSSETDLTYFFTSIYIVTGSLWVSQQYPYLEFIYLHCLGSTKPISFRMSFICLGVYAYLCSQENNLSARISSQ